MPRLKQTHNELAALVWGTASVQGIGTEKMAEILGISKPTVLEIKRRPEHHFDAILRLARYLQIPIDDLRAAIRYPY